MKDFFIGLGVILFIIACGALAVYLLWTYTEYVAWTLLIALCAVKIIPAFIDFCMATGKEFRTTWTGKEIKYYREITGNHETAFLMHRRYTWRFSKQKMNKMYMREYHRDDGAANYAIDTIHMKYMFNLIGLKGFRKYEE